MLSLPSQVKVTSGVGASWRTDLLKLLVVGFVLAFVAIGALVVPPAAHAAVASPSPKKVQLQELTMIDQHTGWALAKDRTKVLFTRRGFAHWSDVTPPRLSLPPNDQLNMITASFFPDASHGYLGVLQNGKTSLWITRDSGKTWKSESFDFSPLTMVGIYQITFIDASHGWIAFDKAHGLGRYQIVLMSTNNGGKTWQQLLDTTQSSSSGLPADDPKDFHFVSTQKGWVTGPEDWEPSVVRLYVTNNGGKNWSRVIIPALPGSAFSESSGPYFQGNNYGTLPVISGPLNGNSEFLTVYHTGDGGKTWASYPSISTTSLVEFRSQFFLTAHEGWTLGLDSNRKPIIHRTKDGGLHWETVHPAGLGSMTEVIMTLDFLTPTVGWTINKADDGTETLFQTNDGGLHWQAQQSFIAA